MTNLQVFRFDDLGFRSHIIARSKTRAIEIFDLTMGKEYRECEENEMEIYPIDDLTLLSISDEGCPPFEEKTPREWIEKTPIEGFL